MWKTRPEPAERPRNLQNTRGKPADYPRGTFGAREIALKLFLLGWRTFPGNFRVFRALI